MNENKLNMQNGCNKTYTVFGKNIIVKVHDAECEEDSLENIKVEPESYRENHPEPIVTSTLPLLTNLKRELSTAYLVFSPPKRIAIENHRHAIPLAKSTPKPIPISVRNLKVTTELFLQNWANDLLGYNQKNVLDTDWPDIRFKALQFYKNDPEIREMNGKITDLVDRNKLMIRKDRNLHTDVSLQKIMTELLFNYNRIWLKLALEIVLQLKSNQSIDMKTSVLSKFLIDNLYRKPKCRSSLYLESYEIDVKKYTLKKLLMLVLFLDRLKQSEIVQYDGCLFHSRSEIKESRQILLGIAREVLKGVGDVCKELNQMIGYILVFEQGFLDEYDYCIYDLSKDMRNGVILMRILEKLRFIGAIRQDFNWQKLLRVPPISRLQKVHNIQMALQICQLTDVIDVNNVCDGNISEIVKLMQYLKQCYNSLQYKKSVRRIEKWWKSSLVQRNVRKRHQSALMIQKTWKSYKVRKEFLRIKDHIIKVQRKFRSRRHVIQDRRQFLRQKDSSIKIQRWFRNVLVARKQHYYYLCLKKKVIVVQQRFRANQLTKIARFEFLNLRFSARILQIRYRARLSMKMCRNQFFEMKSATVKIQAYFRMYQARKAFFKIRKTSIFIQQKFKAKRLMRIERTYYTQLRTVVINVQHKFRSKLETRKERLHFIELKKLTLQIQALSRGWLVRRHLTKLRKAVKLVETKFHSKLLMRIELANYSRIRNSVITIQRSFKNYLNVKKERDNFLKKRSAAIKIQSVIRSFLNRQKFCILRQNVINVQKKFKNKLLMRKQFAYYQRLRLSAIIIQRRFRALLKMREDRLKFITLKNNVISYQAYSRGFLLRKRVLKLCKAVVFVQKSYRRKILMRKDRLYYTQLRENVIKVQRKYRAKLKMRKVRSEFVQTKLCVIKIQAYIRSCLARKRLHVLRKVVIFVQQKFRAKLLMRAELAYYKSLRSSTIKIQQWFKMILIVRQERLKFEMIKKSVNLIQAYFKGCNVRKQFKQLRAVVISLQQHFRANRKMRQDRENYLKLRAVVIFVQRTYRQNLAVKNERNLLLRQNNAVLLIQRVYRGYVVRKNMKVIIRKIKERAEKHFNSQMKKLKYDFTCLTNFDFFSKYSTLMESEKMSNFLNFISRVAPHRIDFEPFVIENGFGIFESVNRSFGHHTITVIWCEIVLNLLKFKNYQSHVFQIKDFMDILMQILNSSISHQTYDIFVRVCTIMWLCLKFDRSKTLVRNQQITKRIEKTEELFLRKYKINEKLGKNNCPYLAKDIHLKTFSMPNTYPDFSVPSKKKPYIFENGLHAILSISHLFIQSDKH